MANIGDSTVNKTLSVLNNNLGKVHTAAQNLVKGFKSVESITGIATKKALDYSVAVKTLDGLIVNLNYKISRQAKNLGEVSVKLANVTQETQKLANAVQKEGQRQTQAEQMYGKELVTRANILLKLEKKYDDLIQKIGRMASAAVAENDKRIQQEGRLQAAAQKMNEAFDVRRARDFNQQILRGQKELQLQLEKNAQVILYLGRIFRRAFSLFEVVSVFRFFDAIRSGFTDGIQKAVEFNLKLAEIQTIDRSITLSNLTASVRELSDMFGSDIFTQAEAFYQTVSNQVTRTSTQTKLFLESANKFALATVSSVEQGVNTLSSTLNAFGLDVSRADEIAASFFKTIEVGRIRNVDLQNSLGDVSNLAKQAGASYQEVNAALALITIQGVKPSEAITRLRNILIKTIKPTEDMTEALRAMGFTTGEAAIGTLGLGGFLGELEVRTKGSATETAALFGNIRAITGAFIFAGENLKKYQTILRQVTDSTKDYDRAVVLVAENAGKVIQKEFEKIKNFFTVDVGLFFIKYLADFSKNIVSISDVVKTFSTLLLASTVPALFAIVTAATLATKALLTLRNTFILSAINPYTAIAAAIGAIISAIVYFYTEDERRLQRNLQKQREANEQRVKDYQEALAKQLRADERYTQSLRKFLGELDRQNNLILSVSLDKNIAYYNKLSDLNKTYFEEFEDSYKELTKTSEKFYNKAKENAENATKKIPSLLLANQASIFDLQLLNKNPQQQLNILAKQIASLRTQAGATNDLGEFDEIADIIDKLVSKRQEIIQELAKEQGIHVNIRNLEREKNDQLEFRKKRLLEIEQVNTQIAAQAKKDFDAAQQREALVRQLTGDAGKFSLKDTLALTDPKAFATAVNDQLRIINELKALGATGSLTDTATTLQNLLATRGEQLILADTVNQLFKTGAQVAELKAQFQKEFEDLQNKLAIKEQEFIEQNGKQLEKAVENLRFLTKFLAENESNLTPKALAGTQEDLRAAKKTVLLLSKIKDVTLGDLPERVALLREQITKLNANPNVLATIAPISEVEALKNRFDLATESIANFNKEIAKVAQTQMFKIMMQNLAPLRFGFAQGGDVVPAMLTPGEFVMNKRSTKQFYSQLQAMNNTIRPQRYEQGGTVIGDINVNVNSEKSPESTGRSIAFEIRRSIRQGLLNVR